MAKRLQNLLHTIASTTSTPHTNTNSTSVMDSGLPDWDVMPAVAGVDYRGCAWGLFDGKDGKKDEIGTLNLLTPARVLAAARDEIRTGESVSLKSVDSSDTLSSTQTDLCSWGLENVKFPGFGRKAAVQKVIDLDFLGFVGNDDELAFNTQCGSQWDGLKHVAHQSSHQYYNGLKHENIVNKSDCRNGLENVDKRGGVCGRAVLLDWASWADKQGKKYNPVAREEIPISDLEAVAKAQGVTFKTGDILLIRSGFVKWHNNATDEERKAGTKDASNYIGVVANEESFKWHWNHHFSAVGGDTVAYEAWPPAVPMLHE